MIMYRSIQEHIAAFAGPAEIRGFWPQNPSKALIFAERVDFARRAAVFPKIRPYFSYFI